MSKASVICSGCNAGHTIEVPASINAAREPELKELAHSGDLFTWECPNCGKTNLVSFPLLYHDPDEKLMLWLAPSDDEVARIKPALDAAPEMEHYTLRVVAGPGDFLEKLKIHEAGLDDVVIEICKHVTCNEMEKDVELRFFRMDGADGNLVFTYPKDGRMEMVAVGFNVYEDCRGIVERNPQIKEAARGLVRIDPDWLRRFFA